MKTGLGLLTDDLFLTAPDSIKNLTGKERQEWVSFYGELNILRDEVVQTQTIYGKTIEDLDSLFKVHLVDPTYLTYLVHFLDVDTEDTDSIQTIRQKILKARKKAANHGTLQAISDYIFSVLGVYPNFLLPTDNSVGWDDDDTVDVPDYNGGLGWDDTETPATLLNTILWFDSVLDDELVIDLGNNGAYPLDDLNKVYAWIQKHKPAKGNLAVGYVQSPSGFRITTYLALENPYLETTTDPGFPL